MTDRAARPDGAPRRDQDVTGAVAMMRSLRDHGVEVCFANPGTSEMHAVAALDAVPGMRGVLCLFEGVATGAADGYARMAGRPAMSLLHLGPGLVNGVANLHNARRAGTASIVVVGDHAKEHKPLDSPLESDIDAVAGTYSRSVRRVGDPAEVGPAVAAAVAATARDWPADDSATGPSGRIATLIVPADVSWSTGGVASAPGTGVTSTGADEAGPGEVVVAVAEALRSDRETVLLLGGPALTDRGLRAVSRIEQMTGVRVLGELWPARRRQGAGIPAVQVLGYRSEEIAEQLAGAELLVTAGTRLPVTSFAYPGVASAPAPASAATLALDDAAGVEEALVRLADLVAPGVEPVGAPARRPVVGAGKLTTATWAAVIGAELPENAIVSDESVTSGLGTLHPALAGAPAHDLLALTGLSIGQGLPVATGAAIACPDRPVVCLQADGSAMYTIQSLWTQARERLDVTTVILNNRSYAILRAELTRVGASDQGDAGRLIDLTDPPIDFAALAAGMGVPASTATTVEELRAQFRQALAEPGPHLIDAVLTTD